MHPLAQRWLALGERVTGKNLLPIPCASECGCQCHNPESAGASPGSPQQ